MGRPWRLLRTAWPWRSAAYLLAELVAGWLTWVAVTTVVLLPFWARGWAWVERRLLPLVGRERLPDPPGGGGVLWREIAHALVTAGAALAGTGLLAGLLVGARATLLAPVSSLPNPLELGHLDGGSPGAQAVAVAVGVVLVPLVLWGVTGLARVYGGLSAAVLSPRTAELEAQVASMADASVAAQDQLVLERRLLQQRLHDGAQLQLTVAGTQLGLLEYDIEQGAAAPRDVVLATVRQVRDRLDEALGQIRDTAQGLMPRVLAEQGLCAALSDLTRDVSVAVEVRCSVPRLPEGIETDLYLIASEAVTNVVKHSGASTATIEAAMDADAHVTLTVRDDGRGGARMAGSGLLGILARARRRGGTASLASPAGGPTTLAVRLPVGGVR